MSTPASSADPAAPPPASSLRRWAPLALLALGAVAGWWFLGDALSFETLRDNREALADWRDANFALAAGAYVLAYVLVVAFSLPGALIMTLTGGFLFGLVSGALLTVTGATLGATAIFVAAKRLEQNESSYLLLMRRVPAVPFFVAILAPAMFGVGLRNYVLTTFFGIMPGTVVYTWVGAGLGEVFDRGGTPELGLLFEAHIIGPLAGLCLLAALPIAVKAIRGGKREGAA